MALLRRNGEYVKRLLVVLSLTACASMPAQKELGSGDYGSRTSQDLAEAKTQGMSSYLNDPVSATYEWKPVYRGWVKQLFVWQRIPPSAESRATRKGIRTVFGRREPVESGSNA